MIEDITINDVTGKFSEIVERCKNCGEVITYKPWDFWNTCNRECKCEYKKRISLKIKKYSDMSVFDKNFNNNTFGNSDVQNEEEEEARRRFYKFCKNFDKFKDKRIGIFMHGNPGTGKTFYTNAILNALKDKGNTFLCWKVSSYIRRILDSYNQDSEEKEVESKLLKAVTEVDLVVLDDLGSEKLSDSGKEKLYMLVDTIYTHNKKLIVSSNNDINYLKKHLKFNNSDKIIDRIKEICTVFNFDWESRRGKNKEELF